jgi:hypothetical protein
MAGISRIGRNRKEKRPGNRSGINLKAGPAASTTERAPRCSPPPGPTWLRSCRKPDRSETYVRCDEAGQLGRCALPLRASGRGRRLRSAGRQVFRSSTRLRCLARTSVACRGATTASSSTRESSACACAPRGHPPCRRRGPRSLSSANAMVAPSHRRPKSSRPVLSELRLTRAAPAARGRQEWTVDDLIAGVALAYRHLQPGERLTQPRHR